MKADGTHKFLAEYRLTLRSGLDTWGEPEMRMNTAMHPRLLYVVFFATKISRNFKAHTSGSSQGFRYSWRVRKALACASSINISVVGSSVNFRPTRAEMFPA